MKKTKPFTEREQLLIACGTLSGQIQELKAVAKRRRQKLTFIEEQNIATWARMINEYCDRIKVDKDSMQERLYFWGHFLTECEYKECLRMVKAWRKKGLI